MSALRAIAIKEIWALLRDPKARIVLVIPPLLQLVIFSFASTLEVKNVDIGLLDRSTGTASVEIVNRLAGSPNIGSIRRLSSHADLAEAIDRQEVIAALVIEPDFDRAFASGQPTQVGVVLDGRRSNAAQIVGGYLQQIVTAAGASVRGTERAPPVAVAINWFNPNLEYIWFNLPSLIVVIVSVAGLSITAQTVARERELGTFDQLMVSPLSVRQILVGKMVPPFIVGFINATVYLVVAQLVFGVPFTGSVLLFYLGLVTYLLALIGVGMFVSSLSMTQQQAFLGSFVATVPVILLSGFSSPIDNMPEWLQIVTYANPARYFLEISLGQFLKAQPASVVLAELWPLVLIALATLATSAWLFRARME
ncbi:ABC transporter permease [Aurantiacibacter xanthus]|uniref:ABC transporter permease n=1 Tax=Aurantiacibacter xanthus TaxID=1784712 RepID=A0A3A1PDH2_9SPHN|nr:ABC transporter permease [Aurantiacibacter xanthus]RIV91818.1 ABC transporter permease [Aurantiacibacter xanthus]